MPQQPSPGAPGCAAVSTLQSTLKPLTDLGSLQLGGVSVSARAPAFVEQDGALFRQRPAAAEEGMYLAA